MAVVLRLQGLNTEAGPEDIRSFFHGLPIPEGGVHITGGQMGEAFIIFSTERAGQLGMLRSGKQLRGSTVTLCKSSMAEFRHKMELKLRERKCTPVVSEPVPQKTGGMENCDLLLNLMAAVQVLQSDIRTNRVQSPPVSTSQMTDIPKPDKDSIEESPIADQPPVHNQVRVAEPARHNVEEQQGGVKGVNSCKPGYLRIYGLPSTITSEEVVWLLEGHKVVDVITDPLRSLGGCCLVKMASFKEAEECLKSSRNYFRVEIRLAHERMWENAMECQENSPCSTSSDQDRFSPDRRVHRNSPVKRPCSLGGSPKRHCSNPSSFDTEYCVMVKNLPNTITKTEIRALFSYPDIPRNKILHLLNEWNERTSTAFVLFTKPEEFTLAMNMNGSTVGGQTIDVSSITKEKMKDLMHQSRFAKAERSRSCSARTRPVLSCIYARNFPAGIRKTEVKDFFSVYNIGEEDIELLEDKNGNGIGEAVIQFGCEEHAREAGSLHGERFGREQILLTCISPEQMNDILHKTQ